MTETLILVRHGEVDGSRAGLLLGRTDVHLSEAGRRQAAEVRDALATVTIDRLFCSPLARTRETAQIMTAGGSASSAPAPPTIETLDDLREADFGDWEGLSYLEVEERHPEAAQAWARFDPAFGFPGGETLAGFTARVGRAAQALAETDARTVVAVSHGGVIRGLLCHFLGLPQSGYLLFDISTGSVTTLRLWGERGILAGLWQPSGLPGSPR